MSISIEIRRPGDDLMTGMAEMRDWLDAQRIELELFRYSIGEDCIVYRLDFDSEQAGLAFAAAFGGNVATGLPDKLAA